MSRKVDLSKPLSEADVQYLASRDRHRELAFNSIATGTELPEEVTRAISDRGITMEAVKKDVAAAQEAAGAPVTARTSENPDDPDSSGNGDDSGPEQGPALYSEEWFDKATIEELKPELKKYELPVTGKRNELADRLYDKLIDEGVITDDDGDDA